MLTVILIVVLAVLLVVVFAVLVPLSVEAHRGNGRLEKHHHQINKRVHSCVASTQQHRQHLIQLTDVSNAHNQTICSLQQHAASQDEEEMTHHNHNFTTHQYPLLTLPRKRAGLSAPPLETTSDDQEPDDLDQSLRTEALLLEVASLREDLNQVTRFLNDRQRTV